MMACTFQTRIGLVWFTFGKTELFFYTISVFLLRFFFFLGGGKKSGLHYCLISRRGVLLTKNGREEGAHLSVRGQLRMLNPSPEKRQEFPISRTID